ncbi:MAG: hypothetical protein M1823_001078 [Watsoniomyces obsoletus]|nr:MAG: hypothetical protein M1823_001078 [Watsoniomyces obsoletus]
MDQQDTQPHVGTADVTMDHPQETYSEAPPASGEMTSEPMTTQELEMMRETEVGITEYISEPTMRFSCTFKKRYTDFLVNEILPSGEVLHLTDVGAPPATQRSETAEHTNMAQEGSATTEKEVTERKEPTGASEPTQAPLNEAAVDAPASEMKASGIESESVPTTETSQAATQESGPESTNTSTAEKKESGIESESTEAKETSQAPTQEAGPDSTDDSFKLNPNDEAELATYFGPDVVQAVVALYSRVLSGRLAGQPRMVKLPIIKDRQLRTKLHQSIRRIFSSKLETSTDDNGTIAVSPATAGSRGNSNGWGSSAYHQPGRGKDSWRQLGGEHLHFTLYKENKDTMEVISFLARQLELAPKNFDFAGTKDRRAITVQRASVYRIHARRLGGLNRLLRGAKLGGFSYHRSGLGLGDLAGNEFVITLRDCSFPGVDEQDMSAKIKQAGEIVGQAFNNLKTKGFINYYGLQRFGAFAARTDSVGIKILQGDFKGACEDLLSYNPDILVGDGEGSKKGLISSEDISRAKAIEKFISNGRSHPAVQIMPKKFSAEHAVIRHLGGYSRSSDYWGALQMIPRNLRLMYIHAYQSLIWNIVAGERWKRFGDAVIEGDLVLIDRKSAESSKGEKSTENDEAVGANPSYTGQDNDYQRARPLTKAEAESGDFTIFDIVLPTPGFDIVYPNNDLKSVYETVMASDRGGGLDPHNMRRRWRDISLSGSYRKLLARPLDNEGVDFEIKTYENENEQLVETDLDRLQKKKKELIGNDVTDVQNKEAVESTSAEPVTQEHGQKLEQNKTQNQEVMETTPAEPVNQEAEIDKTQEKEAMEATPTDPVDKEQAQGPDAGKESPTPPKIAVILRLRLGTSQYATMALRELLGPGGLKTYKPDYSGGR